MRREPMGPQTLVRPRHEGSPWSTLGIRGTAPSESAELKRRRESGADPVDCDESLRYLAVPSRDPEHHQEARGHITGSGSAW